MLAGYALEGRSIGEIALAEGITRRQAYHARDRALRALRALVGAPPAPPLAPEPAAR